MLKRRARTNDFKIRQMTLGRRTRTSAAVCYFDGVVNRGALKELMHRLSAIDIDGVLDSNYLTELIRDNRMSLFRTVGYTERPDVVVGKLLEGRIAVLLDGSPDALTVPYLFIENFQSSEDYYLSFYYTSFSRMLRIMGFFYGRFRWPVPIWPWWRSSTRCCPPHCSSTSRPSGKACRCRQRSRRL